MKENIKNYDKIVIITDDGRDSRNTINLHNYLRSIDVDVELYVTERKVSAKSNSISLKPIKFDKCGSINILDGFPADCFLYHIFNRKEHLEKNLLFISGINEHNHFGYGNYIGSTPSLLILARHFDVSAISISAELVLNNFLKDILDIIMDIHLKNPFNYYSFNINEKKTEFNYAFKTIGLIDKYQEIDTIRGKHICISYNNKEENCEVESDIYFQSKRKNYYLQVT